LITNYRLSKSKYLSAFQCEKKLWLEIHDREKATPIDEIQQAIFSQGHHVGELARDVYPGGTLIDSDYLDIPKGIEITQYVLAKKPPSVFEAFFQYNDVLVRPDIMVNNDDGSWDFIEVKSSTTLKPENIRDVAIQAYVISGCGVKIRKSYLMHLNRECAYPDLDNLFELEDLTEQIKPFIQEMDNSLENLRIMLNEKQSPDISIGGHCTKPYNCHFREHCWQDVPEYSVFNIPGMYFDKKEELYENSIIKLEDVPADTSLNNKQKEFMESYKTKQPVIQKDKISAELKQLTYPLYFLDFETFGPAVPRYDGLHPYEQYPFQYSCHILDAKQELSHMEYLHTNTTDPRLPLLKSLIVTLNDNGSIVAYHAGFEKGVISKLAQQFPEYVKELEAINERFWDQLNIFRKYYTDYHFKGTNGLKSVLPVVVPGMGYSNLNVQEGSQAQLVWDQMIKETDDKKKDVLIQHLLGYCRLDTLAMVEIHQILIK
jgi:hypothetical protein